MATDLKIMTELSEVRDAALEEAAQMAEANGAARLGYTIRAHKGDPFQQPTPVDLQKALGNSQAGLTKVL